MERKEAKHVSDNQCKHGHVHQ